LAKIKEIGNSLALVLLPGVQYYSGQLLEIQKITEATHNVGARAGWDLAHAAGNVEMKLHDWNVDFACWCSYKYLNSGPGGMGAIFVHSKHANNNLPRFAGWWGHNKETRFKMTDPFDAIPGAFGYRTSNPSVVSMMCLYSSLQIFDKYGINNLVDKSKKLTGYLEFLLKEVLGDRVKIVTPSNPSERGAQISLWFSQNRDIEEMLADEGVVCDVRGQIIRAAPTPLYNTFSDVFKFVHILKKVLDNLNN